MSVAILLTRNPSSDFHILNKGIPRRRLKIDITLASMLMIKEKKNWMKTRIIVASWQQMRTIVADYTAVRLHRLQYQDND